MGNNDTFDDKIEQGKKRLLKAFLGGLTVAAAITPVLLVWAIFRPACKCDH